MDIGFNLSLASTIGRLAHSSGIAARTSIVSDPLSDSRLILHPPVSCQ
jgi:hypothetical protein